jgi:hypothetical protein
MDARKMEKGEAGGEKVGLAVEDVYSTYMLNGGRALWIGKSTPGRKQVRLL